MPTVDELMRLIEQANQRTEAANREAEAANQRADRAEAISRKTTLEEYLRACHELVLSKVVLITDGYLSSRSPATNPAGKHCPALLKPWGQSFYDTQNLMIKELYDLLPKNERLFESRGAMQAIGERVQQRKVRQEASLAYVKNHCVEDPVRMILEQIDPSRRQELFSGLSVDFQTTAHQLRDDLANGDENPDRDDRILTEQVCVLRDSNDKRKTVLYVVEYKAPHKLHTSHLERGLKETSLGRIINNTKISTTDKDARFTFYSERLSDAAITQTYHYMLEAGLEYGYVTNGDAIAFLKIDWDDPTTLYFHLAKPGCEVIPDEEGDDGVVYANAVSQVLTFTLLALKSSQHSDAECAQAIRVCREWQVDYEQMLRELSEEVPDVTQQSSPSTPHKARKHRRIPSSPEYGFSSGLAKRVKRGPDQAPVEKSDRVLRSRTRPSGCESDAPTKGPGPDSGSGPGSSGAGPGTGGASGSEGPGSISHQTGSAGTHGDVQAPTSSHQGGGHRAELKLTTAKSALAATQAKDSGGRSLIPRPYCTQECLFSLVNGGLMHEACPNFTLHAPTSPGTRRRRHPVTHSQWTELLREQLSESIIDGIVNLQRDGSCGAQFQITLLRYGYSFQAKGVTNRNVPVLQKEETVYRRLRTLQGRRVPVCLGSVDLRPLGQTIFYDFDVRIIYFLLMAYGGRPIVASVTDADSRRRIGDSLATTVEQMHALGVIHGDIRLPNVLLGGDEPVLVDFDKATLLPLDEMRNPMGALSSNKQRKLLADAEMEQETAVEQGKSVGTSRAERRGMRWDVVNLETLFSLDLGRMIPPGQ